MENFYRLKVTVGKIAFEIESHDKDWVKEKEAKLMGELFPDLSTVVRLAESDTKKGNKEEPMEIESSGTIQEFYQKHVSNKRWPRTKIALFVIYFLEKLRKVDSINTGKVKDTFKEIGYPKYDKINYGDTLNQLKRIGQLNKIGKDWRLTITGQDYVLSQLAKD